MKIKIKKEFTYTTKHITIATVRILPYFWKEDKDKMQTPNKKMGWSNNKTRTLREIVCNMLLISRS